MSFTFKPVGTSSASNADSTATANAPASNMFGSAAGGGTPAFSFASTGDASAGKSTTTPSNTGSVFGQLSSDTATAPKTDANLFASNTPPAPASGGIFGGSGTTTSTPTSNMFAGVGSSSGGGLFASQGSAPQGQATTSNLFGNTDKSLFGKNTDGSGNTQAAAAATPAKPFLALNSTTPAGAPPANSSNAGTGAMGSAASMPNAANAPKPTVAPSASGLFAGTPAAPSVPGNGGGLFGAKQASASGATSSGLFAGAGSSSTPSTTAAPVGGAKPSATSMFGAAQGTPAGAAPASAASANAPSSAAAAGGLFSAAAATNSAPSSTPAMAAPSAGGLFGSKLAGPATAASSATPAATSTAGGLFGNAQSSTTSSPAPKPAGSLFGAAPAASQPAPAGTTTSSAGPTTSAPAAGGFFGAKPSADNAATKKDGLKLGSQTGSTAAALGASTNGPTSQIPRLKNKTMEDIVTRWASDLSKYQKEFKEQATVVSKWDRNLVENGEKIQKLYLDTFEAERASHEIERQLAGVESQQDELEAWLNRYESEVQEMFAKQLGSGEQLAGPDQERERTYKLAEKLTQQLDEKSRDLSKMVKEINDISGTLTKGAKAEDPLSQIVRVLNGHLTQLQWIDSNASALQAKVSAAQKSGSTLGSGYAAGDSDAAESFYRSYMGRR
ncbi:hypothetical protein DCS_05259 [Drechmeria coniospora]|uniref:Nucleoporin NSP1 n=1 Tax=Drechmeria coniospora TaxID=98403 RepID=A0A151GMC0_DRECN|nr:hypothetical protein DCS_05259 [Drechmeria coniospora]KYK58246.1 hypothetical protein DCS_05259 [Drechmeria coniospora]